MTDKKQILEKCRVLREAFHEGELGFMEMPEDKNPGFKDTEKEIQLVYFTLPMSLNYQRNSYTLWESVLESYNDPDVKNIFDIEFSSKCREEQLRVLLLKHKIALQPNKHIHTWSKISNTIYDNWGSIEGLLKQADFDFLKLKHILQVEYKKGFPYLSGPKILNYWAFILGEYCGVELSNRDYIEIAPDTHVKQCSVRLGVITAEQAENISTEEISTIWRNTLIGSGISPIDMHSPLWFWSRNNFEFILK